MGYLNWNFGRDYSVLKFTSQFGLKDWYIVTSDFWNINMSISR